VDLSVVCTDIHVFLNEPAGESAPNTQALARDAELARVGQRWVLAYYTEMETERVNLLLGSM
jgi:hypothetical protein